MKRAFLLFLTIIVFQSFVLAQSQQNNSSLCPTVSIGSSADAVIPGEKIVFEVKFGNGFDTSKLEFIWTVSAGKILKGQKTKSILVEPSMEAGSITAAVEVLGLPKECGKVIISESLGTYCPPVATLVDEYKKIGIIEENNRLNDIAMALQSQPNAIGYILKYFTRNITKETAYQNLQRILNHLEARGVDKNRIIFGATYDKEELTRIFIVPPGAEQPEFNYEILDAAKLDEKLKNIKPAAKKKTAGKN